MILTGSPLDRMLRPPRLEDIRARTHSRTAAQRDGVDPRSAIAAANEDCAHLLREIDRLEQLMPHARWREVHDWTSPRPGEPVLLQLRTGDAGEPEYVFEVGYWGGGVWNHAQPGTVVRVAMIRPPGDWR